MKNKNSVQLFLACLALAGATAFSLLPSGCSSTQTLDTAGVYGSGHALGTNSITLIGGVASTNQAVMVAGMALFQIDASIQEAVDGLESFVDWEYLNRAALAQWPAIKKAADAVRANTPKWAAAVEKQRDAYAAMPNVANQTALEIILKQGVTALSQAQSLMAAHK
jgi:hypothetical protein